MKTRLIGDIHGKFRSYLSILPAAGPSIQIGDYGFGFDHRWDEGAQEWQIHNRQHRFIRGNHDSLQVCKRMDGFIQDGMIENDAMFIGGAWSIDRDDRVEGHSWWADEELSYQQLDNLIDVVEMVHPRIMITHDCPETVAREMFIKPRGWTQYKTRTGAAFEEMFQRWKPECWVFGHWHHNMDVILDGTRFVCLNELAYMDIDLDNHTGDERIIPWVRF